MSDINLKINIVTGDAAKEVDRLDKEIAGLNKQIAKFGKGQKKIVKGNNDTKKSFRGLSSTISQFRAASQYGVSSFASMAAGALAAGGALAVASIAIASTGAVIFNSTKAAIKLEKSLKGLQTISDKTGNSFSTLKTFALGVREEGMIPLSDTMSALKNLLSTGLSADESIKTFEALRDAAAFNRQGTLELGEAILGATIGLKNQRSQMVDNAGITKNLAVMHKEYAKQIGKSVTALSEYEKVQAGVIGIQKEALLFQGDYSKLLTIFEAKVAGLSTAWTMVSEEIGKFITTSNSAALALETIATALKDVAEIFAAIRGTEFEDKDLVSNKTMANLDSARERVAALDREIQRLKQAQEDLNIKKFQNKPSERYIDAKKAVGEYIDEISKSNRLLKGAFKAASFLSTLSPFRLIDKIIGDEKDSDRFKANNKILKIWNEDLKTSVSIMERMARSSDPIGKMFDDIASPLPIPQIRKKGPELGPFFPSAEAPEVKEKKPTDAEIREKNNQLVIAAEIKKINALRVLGTEEHAILVEKGQLTLEQLITNKEKELAIEKTAALVKINQTKNKETKALQISRLAAQQTADLASFKEEQRAKFDAESKKSEEHRDITAAKKKIFAFQQLYGTLEGMSAEHKVRMGELQAELDEANDTAEIERSKKKWEKITEIAQAAQQGLTSITSMLQSGATADAQATQAKFGKRLADIDKEIEALRKKSSRSKSKFEKKQIKEEILLLQEKSSRIDKEKRAEEKKNFEAQKKINIANAVINGAMAITNIWAHHAGNPVLASIMTALSAGAVGAQISQISSQQFPGFAKGGDITGPSSTGDNLLIRANAGERVLTPEQNQAFKEIAFNGGFGSATAALLQEQNNILRSQNFSINIDGEKLNTELAEISEGRLV